MAVFHCEFFSKSLCRNVRFTAVIPNDVPPMVLGRNFEFKRPAKTIYLLHGFSENESGWLYYGHLVELAGKYNVNFVLPNTENWFYLDGASSDRKYATYVGEELVDYSRKVFGFSDRMEDTFIGGYSMGGFGAIHTALSFPDTFNKAMGLSNALIIHNVEKMTPGFTDPIANYEYYKMVFGGEDGDVKKVADTDYNPEHLIIGLQKENKRIPGLYLAIGTEDFLYNENQIFKKFLEEHEVPFKYSEGPGSHNFDFWNQHIEPTIRWMLDEE